MSAPVTGSGQRLGILVAVAALLADRYWLHHEAVFLMGLGFLVLAAVMPGRRGGQDAGGGAS